MLCRKCGFDLRCDQADFCPKCGAPYDQEAYFRQVEAEVFEPRKIKNYLPLAVFAAIFTCVPLGLVAVFYSWKVDKLAAEGKYQEACSASLAVRLWSVAAIVSGIAAAAAAIALYISGMVWLAENI